MYSVLYASPLKSNVLLPFCSLFASLVCVLLHSIVQLNLSPSGSCIVMFHVKLRLCPVLPLAMPGFLNSGGRLQVVVSSPVLPLLQQLSVVL